MWSSKMNHTAFGQMGKSALPRKTADQDRTAVVVDDRGMSQGHKVSYE